MKGLSLVAILVVGACGGSTAAVDGNGKGSDGGGIDAPIPQSCLDAEQHSDLDWIQKNIFAKQCTFSGCHNGAPTKEGMMDLRSGAMAEAVLVNTASIECPAEMRVVPMHPEQSWMMKMLGAIDDTTPTSCNIDPKIGLMPMDNNGELLCQQKLDAISRWIMAGAPAQ